MSASTWGPLETAAAAHVRTDQDDLGHWGSNRCVFRIKLAQGDNPLTCTMPGE
jgi:hypothetical protein